MMEGYLVKWTNIISRWKKRYVVVDKDKFTYYKKKSGKMLGSFTMQRLRIEMVHGEPLGFLLQFHTGEAMHFRANDAVEKQKWLTVLQSGKILSEEKLKQAPDTLASVPADRMMLLRNQLVELLRNRILSGSSKLSKNMSSIMMLQEQLETSVVELMQILSANNALPPVASERAEFIKTCSKELKVTLSAENRGIDKDTGGGGGDRRLEGRSDEHG